MVMLFRKAITGVRGGQENRLSHFLTIDAELRIFDPAKEDAEMLKLKISKWKPVSLVLFMLLVAAALSAEYLEEGMFLLERATGGFFNETLSPAALRGLLDSSLESFARVQDKCERDYWRAQVSYLYGFVEQGAGRRKEAEQRFTEGFELAESSLSCGEFSDGYRLLADTQAQLLMYNGMLYKMEYGPMVREYAEKALELDPGNIKAKLNLALYYKNAPAIAGGSEKTAREILHEIERAGGLEPLEEFSVNGWLGISYAEDNNASTARKYIDRAREIFPGNTWLQKIISEHAL
jgi:tetratricopeptide (TPR) repeat protein